MPYRPTHRQLEYVVALDELRHFGKAAKRCHVSQPTLSVQIGLVERNLGVTLFERTSSTVRSTPVGEEIARRARLALASLDDLVTLATRDSALLGGLIRLGTAPSFGPYFLPHFLPDLHRAFPNLKVYIREDRPAAIETAVLEGVLDCGLGPAPELPGLTFYRIGEERMHLGVPADHALGSKTSTTIAALRGERLLALGSGHRLLDNVRHLADASGAHLVDDYEGTSLDAIRQMVSMGMGLSLFPELYAGAEIRNADDVKLVQIKDWAERREIGFFWRESSGRGRHYRTMAEKSDATARKLRIA